MPDSPPTQDRTLAYAAPSPKRRWLRYVAYAIVIAAVGVPVLGGIAAWIDVISPAAPPLPVTKPADLGVSAPAAVVAPMPLFDADQVFGRSVRPHLESLKLDNLAARDRARRTIDAHFDHARAGADVFARSIIGPLDSMKTLYLMGKGGTTRWWREDKSINPVRNHVAWNYQKHVTSGPKLEAVVKAALVQFEADLRANRNHTLQSINRDLAAEELPVAVVIDEKALAARCDAEVRDAIVMLTSDRVAENAAIGSVGTLAASEAATFAARYLVGRVIVVRLAAIPVSAAVGGTGAGAAVGSAVPGAGTAVGAVTGFLAGLAVDSYMSSKQVDKVTNSVRDVLTTTQYALLEGHNGAAGLNDVLKDALTTQQKAIDRLITGDLHAAATPAAQEEKRS